MGNSLTGATTATVGSTVDLEVIREQPSLTVTATGMPAAIAVVLEGSVDTTTWLPLATLTGLHPADGAQSSVSGSVVGQAGAGVRYVRAHLTAITQPTGPGAAQVSVDADVRS